ncbi:hypothetical protein GCM10011487_22390 [Steroidobacter agaridevorans]|uniref:Uncharacterized protein n=1 Tax=Steroidobacter agaridevorans TaxID=2695856 RepID=A0A829YAA2_9GAMM|nr:hypothetical protein [Steroidobacter agaridevorans]GFE80239.1 hypothetical protein GCM10011487_22390 [Steroidobacter agaridevorans]
MRDPTVTAAVALALAALARSLRTGVEPVHALDEQARAENVIPGSDCYDDAAELIGFPYCRALDLYLPRRMRDRVERAHFRDAHLALTT